jgi:polyketide synthase 12/myxalamid-type polyketide synthase MxaB
LEKRRRQLGLADLTTAEGLSCLGDVLRDAPAQMAIARIDWQRFASQWPDDRRPSWLKTVAAVQPRERIDVERPKTPAATTLKDTIAALPADNQRSAIEQYVHALAIRILGFEGNRRIDPRQPLNELGLDSLMAVEFRNALAAGIGSALPATLLFSYPAIDDVAGYIADVLIGRPQPAAAAAAAPAAAPLAALDAIADLSDEEVDRLLAEKTGGRL